jgi:DNA-directed RNA polymerase specialized sigma24 family protein
MDIKNLTEPQINEICKAFVYGRTIEDIAAIEELSVEDVKQLLSDNAEKVQELKTFYKSMGVI